MTLFGILDVLQGRTTFDRMITNPRGTLYWIPTASDAPQPGSVHICPGNINLYDHGYQSNWEDLMARPLFAPISAER